MVLLDTWLLHLCCSFYLEHASLFLPYSQTWVSLAHVSNIRLLLTMDLELGAPLSLAPLPPASTSALAAGG